MKKMRKGFEKAFVTEKETVQVTWLLILIVLFCLVIELGLAALIFDVVVLWESKSGSPTHKGEPPQEPTEYAQYPADDDSIARGGSESQTINER